jgi:hypothetical protein
MGRRVPRRKYRLLAAAFLVGLGVSAAWAGPSLAGTISVNPDYPQSVRMQPVVPPGPPQQVAPSLTLESSGTELAAGRSATLTARANRSEGEAFALVIRREAGHLGSGLEATCWSQPVCTAETKSDRPSSVRFAAALYSCDQQGVCILEEDASEANKVRVNWR